jgi:hypothetical protein
LISKKSNSFLGAHRKQRSYRVQKNRCRKRAPAQSINVMMSFYLVGLRKTPPAHRGGASNQEQPGLDQQFLLMQSA